MNTLNPQPPVESIPEQQRPSPAPLKTPYHPKPLLITIVIFIVIMIGLTTYLLSTKTKPTSKPPTISPTISQPSPTIDETANWKTYKNPTYGYSLRYPLDVKIDAAKEEAVSFYRNEVAKQGSGGQGRCCGMTIYSRTYESVNLETQTRPIKNITVAGYPAIKWTDNLPFLEDIWIQNSNRKTAVRITMSTLNAIDPYKERDYELFNQILSTFKFLDQSQVSTFQKILEENCIRDNSVSGKIRTEKLPITINSKTVNVIQLSCSSIGTPHTWYIFKESDFFIFDDTSKELGHGGISYFEPYGEGTVDKNRITYYVYLSTGEGPSPIGEIPINVRAIKELKINNDESIYVSITEEIIEADDPRLIDILNQYSMPSEIDPGKKEVSDYEKAENAISARFLGNFDNLESPEREKIEKMKQILGAFSEK